METRAILMEWSTINHFDPEEFDDPEVPGSHVHMDPITILTLDTLRSTTGWPIITHNKYGLRGCVCVRAAGHSDGSRHYVKFGASAVDFHFDANGCDPRAQALAVLQSGFPGIGIYYDWRWAGRPLPVGFHVDQRRRSQIWRCVGGDYFYLLR